MQTDWQTHRQADTYTKFLNQIHSQYTHQYHLISSSQFYLQAPPKQIPKTIENMRVPDETIVDPDDDEVISFGPEGFN